MRSVDEVYESRFSRLNEQGFNLMTNTPNDAELDDVLRVLTGPYRRWTLYLLIEEKTAALDGLVPKLHALNNAANDSTPETEVSTHLHHIDLPKLVDIGVIRHDQQNGEVELINLPDELIDLLTVIKKWEHPAVQRRLP